MITLILRYFGYAKVPVEAVKLAMWIKTESLKTSPDWKKINDAAFALEKLFRSGRQ